MAAGALLRSLPGPHITPILSERVSVALAAMYPSIRSALIDFFCHHRLLLSPKFAAHSLLTPVYPPFGISHRIRPPRACSFSIVRTQGAGYPCYRHQSRRLTHFVRRSTCHSDVSTSRAWLEGRTSLAFSRTSNTQGASRTPHRLS
jgi:hypothetical protein